MHHISQIRAKNFKSIADGTFPLSLYTPLVGYNNAGKTNIIRAIGWIIRRSSLPQEYFHHTDQPVIVEATISGITDEVLNAIGSTHRTRISQYVVDRNIHIRRIQDTPGQQAATIRLEVLTQDARQEEWVVNPTGIDAAIGALFPEPIVIGAMENATEDVAKFGSGTTIGKLLKEMMTPIIERHSPAVAEALQGIEGQLSANAVEKDQDLVNLDERIQNELSTLFPGVSAKTHIPVPTFSDFMKSATIRIFEEGYDNPNGRDASSFGHGAQRSIQIALIKCLGEIRRASGRFADRTTLLLIDEPELYLHPQAIEVVRAALNRLAGDGYQVVIATHSASMISRDDAPNTLLIRRSVEHGTQCCPRIKDAVLEAIANARHQSEALFAISNSSKILFSERVVIAEGKTERTIFPTIFYELFGTTPDEDKIGLVDIGGTSNIPNTIKVLRSMGVPCKAIVDLDFAFKIAPRNDLLDPEHADLIACREILEQLRSGGQIGLGTDGLPTSHNGMPASAAFEILAQEENAIGCIARLHEELRDAGIWLWTRGAIEAHLGIDKTSASHMTFMSSISSDEYIASLPDYSSVINAMNWLRL